IARTVADAAAILGGMVGVDPLDPVTAPSAGHLHTDYRRFLDPNALEGARLGLWSSDLLWRESGELKAVVRRAVERLRAMGATVVDGLEMPTAGDAINFHTDVMGIE